MSGVSGISSLFGTTSGTSQTSSFSLSDYASIKNGSYGKLVKSYYRNEENEKTAAASEKSSANLASVRSGADSLKSAADALSDPKLWEKKKIKTKNEETGEEEEKEDYDWDAITKAVNSFADAYNGVIGSSGNSDSKDVLRNASWMVGDTEKTAKLLEKVGIEVGSDNKLTVNEDKLKEANVGTLKLLFTGHNSFVDKVSSKASSISRAAAKTAATYTKDGTWSNTLNSVVGSQIRKATGQSDKTEDSEKSDKTTTNTDKVDDEIKQLKNRKEKLEAQIKKEYSPERRREYEKELKEIEKELSVKDTDYYRRQNAVVS
ncbi:MAG: hypothetical protein K6G83_14115 [Lachnospiraceae bacterium]|nr:hypothetical protein [Lachnospiraceae bacterium]